MCIYIYIYIYIHIYLYIFIYIYIYIYIFIDLYIYLFIIIDMCHRRQWLHRNPTHGEYTDFVAEATLFTENSSCSFSPACSNTLTSFRTDCAALVSPCVA